MERPRGLTDREWIDVLEERCRQLADSMVPPMTFPAEWGVTRAQSRILRALIARAPHVVSSDALCLAYELPGADAAVQPDTVKVQLHKLRVNLRRAGVAATIKTAWGEGYALDAASAAAVVAAASPGPAFRTAA